MVDEEKELEKYLRNKSSSSIPVPEEELIYIKEEMPPFTKLPNEKFREDSAMRDEENDGLEFDGDSGSGDAG